MSKKSIKGFGSIGKNLGELVPVLVGYAIGQIAQKQLTFLSANPTTGNMVKLAAGLFMAGNNGFLGGVAKGVALNGAAGFVTPILVQAGFGLLPPGVPARYLAGLPEPDQLQNGESLGY